MTLEILTADALAPFRHGFFTRRGGASSGVFSGLNCGNGSSDQTEIVRINRARVAAAMDVPADGLHTAWQVHSTVAALAPDTAGERIEADALVTDRPGRALGVLTADCMPILLADPAARVVGAAHAGWRGALGGIIEATLCQMDRLGADRGRVVAVIGPAISQEAYEVGPEFRAAFVAEEPSAGRFFAAGHGDRLRFDLPAFGLDRLRRAGVAHAEWIAACTYSDDRRFYSFRRSVHRREADYGRLISVIRA